jgi:hypothetical protein
MPTDASLMFTVASTTCQRPWIVSRLLDMRRKQSSGRQIGLSPIRKLL